MQRLRDYSHLFTRHRWRYAVGLFCLLLTNAAHMAIPRVLGAAVDALRAGTTSRAVMAYGGAIVVLAAGQAVVRIGSRISLLTISRNVDIELKGMLHDKLLKLAPSFYDTVRTGDLMSRITNDVTLVRAVAGPGVMYLANALFLYSMAILYMATLDWRLTVLVLLPMPVMAWVVRGLVQRVKEYARGSREALSGLNTVVQENLAGMQVVKSFALEDSQIEKFGDASLNYVDWSLKEARTRARMIPLVGLAGGISSVAVLGVGGTMVMRGELSLGDLVAFLTYVTMIVHPTVALGWILSLLQRGTAALERLDEVLEAPVTISPPEAPRSLGDDVEGAIRVRDLTFNYLDVLGSYGAFVPGTGVMDPGTTATDSGAVAADPAARGGEDGGHGEDHEPAEDQIHVEDHEGGEEHVHAEVATAGDGSRRPALRKVELEMEAGSFVALVGRVGSGKSTLLKALLHLVEVPPGSVFLDGLDITELDPGDLRRRVGYVPQDDFLFSMTVAENVAFGRPGADIDEVEAVTRDAGVLDDIQRLPRQFDTRVGERGLTLSGGQRQRVALARALLAEPKVLVLDNALSHVDSETEREILAALRRRRGLATVVAASNRVTAITDADRIYVLDDGAVVDAGTHDELVERGGLYADMFEQQRLSDRLEAF